MKKYILLFMLFAFLTPAQVLKTGADLLLSENSDLLKGKNIGLVTNHTGLLSDGRHLADVLVKHKEFKLTALYGPEHGIRGDAQAGEEIDSGKDAATGVQVHSLYGKDMKPTPNMLKGIDVLIFDIQDVGTRFYTYISTLFYVLQAAAENNIPVIVLDRPNPITGAYVDGPIRKEGLSSFVGIAPIPIAHGMTVGELAGLFSGEGWLKTKEKPRLTVIKMEGWDRTKYFDEYYQTWVKPSPNIPDFETALVYPGTCLIEGINVSEGRGTLEPFLKIGAPYIKSAELIKKLVDYGITAVEFEEIEFTPKAIQGMSENPKYKDQKCNGISIKVRNRKEFQPVQFGIKLVSAIRELYPDKVEFLRSFDLLSGDISVRESIIKGKSPDLIIRSYKKDIDKFLPIRDKYLLYN
jgi:uncharacterized protein YbbC (DUF1343 family)